MNLRFNLKNGRIIIFTVISLCIFNLVLDTNFIGAIDQYILNNEYRRQIVLINGDNHISNILFLIKSWFSNYSWKFDYINIWATNLFQIFTPLFPIVGVLYLKKKSIKFSKINIFKYSLYFSIFYFIGFFFFYNISYLITGGELTDYISRNVYNELFGDLLCRNLPYIYYLLEGITKFFLLPFFSCAIGLMIYLKIQNVYKFIKYSILYFLLITTISSGLSSTLGDGILYFNPNILFLAGAYENINILFSIFINLFIMLMLNVGCEKNYEK